MRRNGESVPDFLLTDVDGNDFRLLDYVKGGITILSWIRGEW